MSIARPAAVVLAIAALGLTGSAAAGSADAATAAQAVTGAQTTASTTIDASYAAWPGRCWIRNGHRYCR